MQSDLLKIVSWNVASLRAAWRKGFAEFIQRTQPDIVCLQETKMYIGANPPIESLTIPGYHGYFNNAQKKGYAGTAIYTKIKPLSITNCSDIITDQNGRCIAIEFSNFVILNTYVVNAGEGTLKNLQYKIEDFNTKMEQLLDHLHEITRNKQDINNSSVNKQQCENNFHPPLGKLLIWTGDLNVAHEAIDIWSVSGNSKRSGFTDDERKWFDHIIKDKQYVDIFRCLYPNKQQFSYFEQKTQSRKSGRGMRIDYFIANKERLDSFNGSSNVVIDCAINTTCDTISDHNPIILALDKSKVLTCDDKVVDDFTNETISKY